MITFPNAKINLGLNIVEKRPDGYHNLETVFYPVRLEDALEVCISNGSAGECRLHQSGVPIEGDSESNLVVKAYRLLEKSYCLPAVDVYLYKHIPSGAGLGGGSSDAAYMLKSLNELLDLHIETEQLEAYAATLGADCAFFIRNHPVFAEGIGNVFSPIDFSLQGWYVVLVKPAVFVSTREAFSLISPQKPVVSIQEIIRRPVNEWKDVLVNDFEKSVFAAHPEIEQIRNRFYDLGAVYAAMSGSGSSVFGLFSQACPNCREWFPGNFVWTGAL